VNPSAIVDSVLLRRSGCTPSSANRGPDSVCISMGERREHGRTSSVRDNHMRMGIPHAYMEESMESLSASSLSVLLQVRRLLFGS
jgi:hypothetical protein